MLPAAAIWSTAALRPRSSDEASDTAESRPANHVPRGPLDRPHGGTPHPGPLPFRRGEGESSPASGVVYVANYSVNTRICPLPFRISAFVILPFVSTP